jgi:hypothetical protein
LKVVVFFISTCGCKGCMYDVRKLFCVFGKTFFFLACFVGTLIQSGIFVFWIVSFCIRGFESSAVDAIGSDQSNVLGQVMVRISFLFVLFYDLRKGQLCVCAHRSKLEQ